MKVQYVRATLQFKIHIFHFPAIMEADVVKEKLRKIIPF